MIVRLAIRVALPLKEVARAEFLIAVSARKVFRMPRLAQSCYHLRNENMIESER